MRKMNKILMTGSDGYIGSHLKPYLENKQIIVTPFIGDINEFFISQTPSMILHLAALTGVRKSVDNPEEYWKVNVGGTRKVFQFSSYYNIPILFASSSNAIDVTNPYAQTKITNDEQIAKN